MSSKSKGLFYFGLISGAAIGTTIGFLFAPDKGGNTRDKLSYRINSYLDDLSRMIEKIRYENQIVSDAKKEGELVVEEAQKRAEDLISEAEDLLKNIGESKKPE